MPSFFPKLFTNSSSIPKSTIPSPIHSLTPGDPPQRTRSWIDSPTQPPNRGRLAKSGPSIVLATTSDTTPKPDEGISKPSIFMPQPHSPVQLTPRAGKSCYWLEVNDIPIINRLDQLVTRLIISSGREAEQRHWNYRSTFWNFASDSMSNVNI